MNKSAFEPKKEVVRRGATPPPPPPPPLPKSRSEESVTKREIAKFWRQKRIVEEDHLLAAIKASARLRARNLTEEEYRSFEYLSLKTESDYEDEENRETVKKFVGTNYCGKKVNDDDMEVRVGIKDWWTKSKYAYLNQPAIDSMDPSKKKRISTYVPNFLSYKPKALYPTAIGVF